MNSTTIILNPQQAQTVDDLIAWYKTPRKQRKKVFSVAGYAGTGKSTTVKYAIEALELDPMNDVAYCTYTGKAALVLSQKGNPAQTIHKLIYWTRITEVEDPDTKRRRLVMTFELRSYLEEEPKLIVVDEISMVPEDMMDDLLSFGIPILVLGDPAQLPPVKGRPSIYLEKPDAFLTQIHRQAADSPILWASMLAREGYMIPHGFHGGALHVIPMNSYGIEHAFAVDQMIVCKNETRRKWNALMRWYKGYTDPMPQPGEKLICLKNNWQEAVSLTDPPILVPMVNGLHVRVATPPEAISTIRRTFITSVYLDGYPEGLFKDLLVNLDYFDVNITDPQYHPKRDVSNFDFGDVITCHKSQGSEFGRVLYVHEGFGDYQTQQQLLYTGISRASDYLILAYR